MNDFSTKEIAAYKLILLFPDFRQRSNKLLLFKSWIYNNPDKANSFNIPNENLIIKFFEDGLESLEKKKVIKIINNDTLKTSSFHIIKPIQHIESLLESDFIAKDIIDMLQQM